MKHSYRKYIADTLRVSIWFIFYYRSGVVDRVIIFLSSTVSFKKHHIALSLFYLLKTA